MRNGSPFCFSFCEFARIMHIDNGIVVNIFRNLAKPIDNHMIVCYNYNNDREKSTDC